MPLVKHRQRQREGAKDEMVSVIVPVYNVEAYLAECLDSIVGQCFRDFEVLLVDDGSTDGSGRICEEYAGRDSRIRVLHKENGGLSDARNMGIRHAQGSLLLFVDSDDLLHPELLEVLYHNLEAAAADVSMCAFEEFYETGQRKSRPACKAYDAIYGMEDYPEQIHHNYKCMVVAWNKLYRRELFRELAYPAGRYHEDEFVLYDWLYACRKIVFTRQKLYYYRQREESISHRIGVKNVLDIKEAMARRLQFCRENRWDEMYAVTCIRILHTLADLYRQLSESGGKKAILEDIKKDFRAFCRKREVMKRLDLTERAAYSVFSLSPGLYLWILSAIHRRRGRRV